MKKISTLVISILFLSGCISPKIVDGRYSKTDYQARGVCAINVGHKDASSNEFLTESNFKVTKKPNGDWLCRQVYGEELERQRADSTDEYKANLQGVNLNEYRKQESIKLEAVKKAHIDLYTAKEHQYEQYRKDGGIHTDVYTDPDGTIRAITIQGDNRCDSYSNDKNASFTCN